jgi:hypothetical protein
MRAAREVVRSEWRSDEDVDADWDVLFIFWP